MTGTVTALPPNFDALDAVGEHGLSIDTDYDRAYITQGHHCICEVLFKNYNSPGAAIKAAVQLALVRLGWL